MVLLANRLCIPDRDRAFDHHIDIGVGLHDLLNGVLNCACIEVILLAVVVGRRCYNDEFHRGIGRLLFCGRVEVQPTSTTLLLPQKRSISSMLASGRNDLPDANTSPFYGKEISVK